MARFVLMLTLAVLTASCAVLDYADSLRDEPIPSSQTARPASAEASAP